MDTAIIVDDLKQFITVTIGQLSFDMNKRMDGLEKRMDGVETKIDKVETKIDDLTIFVADALDNSNEATDSQLKDHEQRITMLEQKPV
jgi:hypothetical protein